MAEKNPKPGDAAGGDDILTDDIDLDLDPDAAADDEPEELDADGEGEGDADADDEPPAEGDGEPAADDAPAANQPPGDDLPDDPQALKAIVRRLSTTLGAVTSGGGNRAPAPNTLDPDAERIRRAMAKVASKPDDDVNFLIAHLVERQLNTETAVTRERQLDEDLEEQGTPRNLRPLVRKVARQTGASAKYAELLVLGAMAKKRQNEKMAARPADGGAKTASTDRGAGTRQAAAASTARTPPSKVAMRPVRRIEGAAAAGGQPNGAADMVVVEGFRLKTHYTPSEYEALDNRLMAAGNEKGRRALFHAVRDGKTSVR